MNFIGDHLAGYIACVANLVGWGNHDLAAQLLAEYGFNSIRLNDIDVADRMAIIGIMHNKALSHVKFY